MTGGEKICTFIEHYVFIPEGAHVGQSMKLMKFQKQFILEVYDNPAGTSRAYLSVAPKISKLFSRWLWIRKTDVKWVYNALKQLRVGQPSKRSDNSAE